MNIGTNEQFSGCIYRMLGLEENLETLRINPLILCLNELLPRQDYEFLKERDYVLFIFISPQLGTELVYSSCLISK